MTISERFEKAGTSRVFKGDRTIWAIYFLLCAVSLVEVYSSASTLSYATGAFWSPVLSHGLFILAGILIVIVAQNIPSSWFKLYFIFMGSISFILLLVVLLSGTVTNGARRWFELPFIGMTFQPSEMAKGAVVIGVAFILSFTQTENGASRHAFNYILPLTVSFCFLIAPENLSTALILALVVAAQMFIGCVPVKQIGTLIGIIAVAAIVGVCALMGLPEKQIADVPGLHRFTSWKSRIEHFTDKDTKLIPPEQFDIDKEAQMAHARIAVASGGLVGKFPGNSEQRDFLSQAYSDFIYAIIIEETGLFGGICVAALYFWLLIRVERIAGRCERNFPAFMALGLALLLVFQAIVNMAVAVGAIPITGQPLPLISRGGTSMIFNSLYIGMILSVSRFAKRRSDYSSKSADLSAVPVPDTSTEKNPE